MRLDTGLLLGLLTISVTALGIMLSRRGQKEQARQQVIANDLADRAERFDELNELVKTLTGEISRLRSQIGEMEGSHNAAFRAQAQRCQETVNQLVDTVATLQTVVQDEVARAAAFGDIGIARTHAEEHEDHLGDRQGGG